MLRFSNIFIFSICFAFLLGSCQAQKTAIPPLTARVSELQGTVLAKQAGQANFAHISNGYILQENSQIQTGDNGRVRLDLSTGTIFRLAPLSLFTLISNTPTNGNLASHLRLDAGRLWIILKGGSVDVDTPSGVASVRGSYLMVQVLDNGAIQLTCLEGNCSLHNDSGDYPMTTGQTAVVLNAQTPPFIQPMTEQEVQEWLDSNPEATLVVPSLTRPAPSATSQATATSKATATLQATATNAPPTATSVPTATRVLPTNTWVPAPPPPPKKSKPSPSSNHNNLVYLASNYDINASGHYVTVSPGAPVTVQFIYIIWNQASCPSCTAQLVVGLDDGTTKTGYDCGYNGIPGTYPGTGPSYSSSTPVTFNAPTAPGTYNVGINITQESGCNSAALAAYATNSGYTVIGTITVP